MQKLDEHGDDYHNSMPPIYNQLMADIRAESLPAAQPSLFAGLSSFDPESPGQARSTTQSSVKKAKGRGSSKQEERDPNAPKKPANAFFMFCQQQRTVMQEDQKDSPMGHHELTKTLAKEWNNLVPEEKKVYYVMYEKDKERYEQEMKTYTPDKVEKTGKKESTSKKHKKPTKLKGVPTATVVSPPASEQSEIDPRLSLTVSPTLNPLSPQSLTAVPFNLPQIPSPTIPLPEGGAFDDLDQLPLTSQETFNYT